MGCHFFVSFTQLVSTSSTAASARPIQLTVPSQENRIKRESGTAVLVTRRSTCKTTPAQAAPIRPLEAGRRP